MKPLLALYFFILATLQLGLLLGTYHYYQARNLNKPSPYWLGSLIVNIFALSIFGYGILGLDNFSRPAFNFTIANALFYIASISLMLFSRDLNNPISKNIKIAAVFSTVVYVFIFETLRQHGNYEQRTMLFCATIFIFLFWSIAEVSIKRRSVKSPQLLQFQVVTIFQIVFVSGRFFLVFDTSTPIVSIEDLPQLLILFTIFQLVLNTLAYIAVGSYWAERTSFESIEVNQENEFVKSLLLERENLISSLLMANKTVATGALSASIAHELNQPLAAIQLNTQYLQMKLDSEDFDIANIKQITSYIESDNKRIARIVSSLRNIFGKESLQSKLTQLNLLIESLMPILLPQSRDRGIQLAFNLNANRSIYLNESEFKQVLLNLVNNAVEALAQSSVTNKKIIIQTADVDDYVELKIIDNGPGISEDLRSNLFNLMKSNKDTGMGLGLWLCKHIVERHQGKISAQNLSIGGAEFKVSIPFAID